MAKRGRRGGGGKRRGSSASRSQPGGGRRLAPGEIHRLLDLVDVAMLGGDLARVQAINAQLVERQVQTADALAERLIDGRARVPMLAFDLLELCGGKRADSYLLRIASEPRALDMVRWGARRRLGWPDEDDDEDQNQARGQFLASLRDPDGTLLGVIEVADAQWPPDTEILQEVLDYLVGLPSERRLRLVQRAIAQEGPDIAWLLRALVHLDDAGVQRLAISELLRLQDRAAVGALLRLGQTTADGELRSEAQAAARRLRMRLVGADEASAARERQAWPEVDRVAMTEVDGEGGQAVLLTRCWDEHVGMSVNLLARDDWGIMGVHGLRQAPAEDLFEVVSGALEEEAFPLVDVDLAAARGAVLSALQANAATGHPVPCEFELWEPFLHDTFPPQDDEPVLAPELDDAPYAGRRDLSPARTSCWTTRCSDPGSSIQRRLARSLPGCRPPGGE